jgi:hypothetical protein
MAILSGRYGSVKYDPAGTTPVEIVSLNTWKASFKTDYEDVTCFNDPNKVYVPGMMDVSGTVGGFWNSDELTLFDAAVATVPGLLELVPNRNEATFKWSGLAYLDADIDCSLAAPKVTGNFRAAGPWTMPAGAVALGDAARRAAEAAARHAA